MGLTSRLDRYVAILRSLTFGRGGFFAVFVFVFCFPVSGLSFLLDLCVGLYDA